MFTVLDSGCCLVGGTKTVSFNCVNNGGPGKFCIVDGSDWPTTSWKVGHMLNIKGTLSRTR